MNNEKNNENKDERENKKRIILICVCFIGAIIFMITSYTSYKYGNKDNQNTQDESSQNANNEKQDDEFQIDSTYSNESRQELTTEEIEQLLENADTEPLDQTEAVDTTYNSDFNITGFNDELLPFIDNDLQGMSENIQETLYANGYYDYTSASFKDQADLDYRKASVTLYFLAYCNTDVNISVTYYRDKHTWYTQIW